MSTQTFLKTPILSKALTVIAANTAGLWVGGELWGFGSLWFSSDGETFIRKAVPKLYTWVLSGILPTRDGELLAAGKGGIVRSSQSGDVWPSDAFGEDVWALYRAADDTIWAGGSSAVHRSSDDGRSWSTFAKTETPIYCFVETPTGLLALGERCFRVGPKSLEAMPTGLVEVRAASIAPDGTIAIVGNGGLVAVSQDGVTWKTVPLANKADLTSVAYCGDRFYIGGDDPDDFEAGQEHAAYELHGGKLRPLEYRGGRGGQTDFNGWAYFQGRTFLAVVDKPSRPPYDDIKGYLFTTGPVNGTLPRSKPDYAVFRRGPAGESAEQALCRYGEFIEAARADPRLGNREMWDSDNKLVSRKPISARELAKAEKRLGVSLPTSYKTFITTKGLFSLGDGCESQLLPPSELTYLDKSLAEEADCDLSDLDLSPDEIKYLGKTIPFSYGDAQLGIVKYYGFRVDGLENGECPVVTFDEDQMGVEAVPLGELTPFAKTFDEHVSAIVNEKISTIEEYLEEGRYL